MKRLLFIIILLFQINVYANEDLVNLTVNGNEVSCSGYECNIEIDSNSAEVKYELGENVKSATPNSGHKISLDNDYSLQIEVTYNDDTTANYTLAIKKHVKSSDNTLKELVINDENVELMNDVFVYSYETKFDDEVVFVKGITNDQNAECEDMEYDFKLEKSSLSITYPVTAEDGSVKNYTIILKRKNKPDTTLKTLTLSDIELDFDKNKLEYEVTIPYSIDSCEIKAIANDKTATVSVSMEEFFVVGENLIEVSVTNNEATDVYVIKINRLDKVDEDLANLESLKIEGYNLKFSSKVLDYTLTFVEIPTSLNISTKPVSDEAKVTIENNENLNDGSVVLVKVSLENGLVKTYQLKIELEKADEEEFKVNKILVIILIVVLLIVMIVLFILQMNEGKKNKKGKHKNSVKKIKEEEIEVI